MRRLHSEQPDLELSKKSRYDDLRNEDCEFCPLYKTAQHVCLIGRGNLNAEVFFVGEAPGKREDDIGKPFAGRSGKLLEDVLTELDESRETVYISNVVHCRPPDNRTPSLAEAKKCVIYLQRELDLVRPKIIVPLGNAALKAVTKRSGITRFRGTTLEYEGNFKATILPTFHPAAILRNPGYFDNFVEDLAKVFEFAKGEIEYGKCKWKLVTTMAGVRRLIQKIKSRGYCSTDTETNTLLWWRDDAQIAGISFSCESGSGYFIPLDHNDSPFSKKEKRILLKTLNDEVFTNEEVIKIGQNIKYDMHMLKKYGCEFRGEIHDTMFLHFLLNENIRHDLDSMSLEYTNYGEYWKEVNGLGLKQGKALGIDLDKLGKYGATDSDVTLKVYEILQKKVKAEKKLWQVYRYIHIPSMLSMFEAEERGMQIDLDRLDTLQHQFRREIESIKTKLRVFPQVKKLDEMQAEEKGKKYTGVNFNSAPQMQRLLFTRDGFNAKSIRLTDVGNPSADEDSLIALIHKRKKVGEFARVLLSLRKVSKLDSTYISGLYKHLGTDEKVHPNFKITGTKPGRMSCTDPNVQQIPRAEPVEYDSPLKAEVKTVYIPHEGYVYLIVDSSQAELRIMTHYSGEKTMLKWFRTGKDVHEYVAAKMLGLTIEQFRALSPSEYKSRRKRAKTVGFGTIYKVGKYTLAVNLSSPAEGIYYTPNQAQEFLDEYFHLFPAILVYMEDMERRARKIGYVETLFGQRRRLPDIDSNARSVREEAVRQAVNSPIQGTAAQYVIFGMNYLMGYVDGVRRIPPDMYLVNQVHDDIMFEVRPKDVKEVARKIVEVLGDLPTKKYFGFRMKVPMAAGAEIGRRNWAILEKVEF